MGDIDAQIEAAKQEMVDASTTRDAAQNRLVDLRRVKELQDTEHAKKVTGVNACVASDYATMCCVGYRFYFGYEYTVCPSHGNDAGCDCAEEEWAFVAWGKDDTELMRLPQSRMWSQNNSGLLYLLHGIGQFINTLPQPKKPARTRRFDVTGGAGDGWHGAGDPC